MIKGVDLIIRNRCLIDIGSQGLYLIVKQLLNLITTLIL